MALVLHTATPRLRNSSAAPRKKGFGTSSKGPRDDLSEEQGGISGLSENQPAISVETPSFRSQSSSPVIKPQTAPSLAFLLDPIPISSFLRTPRDDAIHMNDGDATPDTPRQTSSRRRVLNSRACDRCRRRKAKCDATGPRDECSLCRQAEETCTFELPMARRGPKAKRTEGSTAPGEASSFSIHGDDVSVLAAATTRSPNTSTLATNPLANYQNLGNSPAAAWTSPGALSDAIVEPAPLNALQRWRRLTHVLTSANFDPEQIISKCFELFFEYLFPLTPLVHEPSIRAGLAGLLVGTLDAWPESTFTLITAVCAEAAFLLPKDVFPEGETVGPVFLRASRDCLNSYLEADLEAPSSSSIAIRYFHSNCIHATGKPKYSWHIFGEATRLAQVMQLHQESALEGLPPVEAEFRRRVFWIVYMGDKSAAILNNRPITLHRFSFEQDITTAFPVGMDDDASVTDLSPAGGPSPRVMESRNLITGFNANLQLWQAASELLLELRLLQDSHRESVATGVLPRRAPTIEQRQRLDDLYVHFITCLDGLPPYLQSCSMAAASGQGMSHTTQLVIQCANLQVSFHCLRMVITQRFEDMSYLGTSLEQADLRRTEIARDMLRVMQEAPFWSLQVNGEPYVEKIRLIGASLLAIVHRNQGSPLATRARADFSVLLDTLTRLDSKASDALRSNLT